MEAKFVNGAFQLNPASSGHSEVRRACPTLRPNEADIVVGPAGHFMRAWRQSVMGPQATPPEPSRVGRGQAQARWNLAGSVVSIAATLIGPLWGVVRGTASAIGALTPHEIGVRAGLRAEAKTGIQRHTKSVSELAGRIFTLRNTIAANKEKSAKPLNEWQRLKAEWDSTDQVTRLFGRDQATADRMNAAMDEMLKLGYQVAFWMDKVEQAKKTLATVQIEKEEGTLKIAALRRAVANNCFVRGRNGRIEQDWQPYAFT